MSDTGKSVLVATDLNARCDRAIDRATMLAHYWNVRLKVVHVLEPGAREKAESALLQTAMRATLPDPGADVDILLPSGSAPETIARTADEAGSGLIVTGVARYNNVGDYFLGTAVDHIVRHAKAPVLVVKQRPRGIYRSLLVATDLSECSRAALLRAAELFPDAMLHLVHAYHVPYEARLNSDEVRGDVRQEAQRHLDAFLDDPALPQALRKRIEVKLGYGETATVVGQALRETGADLVVLGTHGRSGFSYATIGSTAASLLSCVTPDTLMISERMC